LDALEKIVQTWRRLAEPERWVLNSVVKDLASERLSFGVWLAEEGLPWKPSFCYRNLEEIPPRLMQVNVYPHWGCFFNGTLLPVKLIEQIGLPREEFFIRGDEVEYFYRISRRFRVGTALESLVRHPLEETGKVSLPAWKTYFQTRNNTVIDKTYFPSLKTQPLYLYLKAVKHNLLGIVDSSHKAEHEVTALAIRDAMRDKFDRNAFDLGK
jgi:GT2 family glycosyltransferase